SEPSVKSDRLLGVRDDDARQIRARSIQHGDIPDPVHQGTPGSLRQIDEKGIARLAASARRLDLDELMVMERPRGLLGDGVRQTRASEADDRLQSVSEAAQVAALFLGQLGDAGTAWRWRRSGGR